MTGFNIDPTGSTNQMILLADNVDFRGVSPPARQITTNGQLLIGSTAAPNILAGNLTSPLGTITIGYSSPNITLDTAGGQAIVKIGVDTTTGGGTNPVLPTAAGLITYTGGQYPTGTFGTRVLTINSPAVNTVDVEVQISTTAAASNINLNGIAHFNSADFTVDANGFVTAIANTVNYTNVNHAASPYTVLSTDYYISVDCSAGTVQLNFPNAPTFKRQWIIKDRTGNASTNNITLTTPGGTVTFDGLTTYTMNSNYQAINLLANATPTYEVY